MIAYFPSGRDESEGLVSGSAVLAITLSVVNGAIWVVRSATHVICNNYVLIDTNLILCRRFQNSIRVTYSCTKVKSSLLDAEGSIRVVIVETGVKRR